MRRLTCGAAALLSLLALGGGTASAAPVTVGAPLFGPFGSSASSAFPFTLLNVTIAEPGALASSPANGVITSWNFVGGVDGPFRLRVLRPAAGAGYTAVGTSAAAIPAGTGLETQSTSLPIQAGDTIGLDLPKGAKIGAIPNPASTFTVFNPSIVEGTTQDVATAPEAGVEFAFNAVVQPAPTVASVAPRKGSFKGGTRVRINGADFSGVSTVSFGGRAAKSFTVDSETQITAVAPARGKPGKVDVTVTTIAGTSAAVGFTATACVVPKLKRKSLRAAKKKLKKAGCKVGKVTRPAGVSAKTGVVVKQGKPAGKKLVPGAKVSLTLG